MKKILSLLIIPLPWFLKRLLYKLFFKYELHPTSRIGLSWVMVDNLSLAQDAKIGNLNVIKGLNNLQLGERSRIGSLNWITAFPLNTNSPHFQHEIGQRMPELVLGEHTAITNRHLIDCTNRIEIKRFTTFAGFRSTVLTHSIDLKTCRQASKPITIGEYCFIGTGCILLGGTIIPDNSVLAAGSTITSPMDNTYSLYGGTPAKFIKSLEKEDLHYFKRTTGFIY
ncbi:acyltransferase [Methylobacter psychrophilus]|uniref:acyltransferase n=1 Tax=Methylobacter psychrophilus TaxID=96941 RepID=UPI0021D4EF13|nr:acyltransferase [Methylobacter psychrophilus]